MGYGVRNLILTASVAIAMMSAAGADVIVYEFTQSASEPCRKMDAAISAVVADGLPLIRVDCDENRHLVEHFGVLRVPIAIALVDGVESFRVNGVLDENTLRQVCNGVDPGKQASDDLATSEDASVRIRVAIGGGYDVGSGTVVRWKGRQYIITCWHVFRNEGPITVEAFHKSAGTYKARILAIWPAADVAIAAVDETLPAVDVATKEAEKNQNVYTYGCSNGAVPTRMNTRVVLKNRYRGPANMELSIPPQYGRSGGGVFDASGKLVGVCFARDDDAQTGVYAGLPAVQELLSKLN